MKLFTAMSSLVVLACGAAAAELKRVEISSTDVATLVGKRSEDLSVFGLYLGMPRPEAEALLGQSKKFIAVSGDDEDGPSHRIYVYARSASNEKTGPNLLNLSWVKEWPKDQYSPIPSPYLQEITIYEDTRPYLKPNVKRLLTADAAGEKSPFRKKFLGAPSRTIKTPALATIGSSTTHFYREIGLDVSAYDATGRMVLTLKGRRD